MAGVDKMNEFYTCLDRFAFLSDLYRPEGLEVITNIALDELVRWHREDKELKKRIESAKDYFSAFDEQRENRMKKDLIDYMLNTMSCE